MQAAHTKQAPIRTGLQRMHLICLFPESTEFMPLLGGKSPMCRLAVAAAHKIILRPVGGYGDPPYETTLR
jgi:hypothetical protein